MTECENDGASASRRPRHVVEMILMAFHHACDVRNYEIAWRLLVTAENGIRADQPATPALQRTMAKKLVSAHERLWDLQREDAEASPLLSMSSDGTGRARAPALDEDPGERFPGDTIPSLGRGKYIRAAK